MLDIIFLSYDEPNADANYAALKARFPHARRVHGVKGIANAHFAAAKKAMTQFFYVVDADAVIHPSFDFTFKPGPGDEDFVHLWYAFNPAIGIRYGYGGVKLFNKSFFKEVKSQLDFTTTLTKDIKIHTEVACTTQFNSDQFRAFRGAFREAVKLRVTSKDESKSSLIRQEAEERLNKWRNPLPNCSFRSMVVLGVQMGVDEADKRDDLLFINDHDITPHFADAHIGKEIDLNTDPQLPSNHPMKPEFFFTTRIASGFYDEYVLKNLPITEIRDAMSDGQVLSKLWLVELVKCFMDSGDIKAHARVVILGGWIGTLALMLNAHELPLKIVSVDLDTRANTIASTFNYGFDFEAKLMDMYDVNYDEFDVVINTSSEHIPNIEAWREKIPSDKIVIVQNNNFIKGEGHVSCVENSDELRRHLKLEKVLYEGTRKFQMYDRYMIIGRT